MTLDMAFLGMDVLTIVLFLLILIFSIGIVWRVEKELDWSYKFFVVAAASVMLADVVGLSAASQETTMILIGKSLRFVGAVSFLVSILFMRGIVQKLDHEKE
ncbi:MAG: hypothetical protein KBA91_01355 [Candidatus Moranbacteria bacterium]|jgi:hypothetical protein|nr:hypothetical protein [Candidatus Moranbacteria bacterium]